MVPRTPLLRSASYFETHRVSLLRASAVVLFVALGFYVL